MEPTSFHNQVGEALRVQYGQLAHEVTHTDLPQHFAVRFPGAPIPYQVIVMPIEQEGAKPLLHVETLVAGEELDWSGPGLAQAILAENDTCVFARYSRRDALLVAEADVPGDVIDGEATASIVNAVAEAAVRARELLVGSGALLSMPSDD